MGVLTIEIERLTNMLKSKTGENEEWRLKFNKY
jgi:hypothetical protein